MKVTEIIQTINGNLVAGKNNIDSEITGGYISDMLSDVMGNADTGMVWITMQAHNNILAVASLKDIAAIVIIGDHKPGSDVISKADEEGIPIILSPDSAFEVGGKLYRLLSK